MSAAVQARWCYVWSFDQQSRRGELYARDVAALATLADGTMGEDLPMEIRRALPAASDHARARAKALAAASIPREFQALPQLLIVHAGGAVEYFEAVEEWDVLQSRLVASTEGA